MEDSERDLGAAILPWWLHLWPESPWKRPGSPHPCLHPCPTGNGRHLSLASQTSLDQSVGTAARKPDGPAHQANSKHFYKERIDFIFQLWRAGVFTFIIFDLRLSRRLQREL